MEKNISDAKPTVKSMAAVLDKTDAYIFFSDMDTREVVYVNEKMKNEFDHVDCSVLRCDELLELINNSRCETCTSESLESAESRPVIRFFCVDNKRHYKRVDSLLEIEDGRNVIMHHITEIPSFYTEQADKEKTDFLSRMSHELYTPMNTIISMSHLAVAADDTESVKSCVSMIYKASTQLHDVINDILDMSRIEMGQVTLVSLPFSLDKMLDEACGAISSRTDEQGRAATVRHTKEDGVPMELRGDEYRLSQAVSFLIKSMMKFQADRCAVDVRVSGGKQSGGKTVMEFSIVDAEGSVPKDREAQLLGAFELASDGGYINYGEASLGATISKKIIEMMGGSIWTARTPEGRLAFHFTIQTEVFESEERSRAIPGEPKEGAAAPAEDDGDKPKIYEENRGFNKYLPYINVDEGLTHIGGNMKLFGTMLKSFRDGRAFSDLKDSVEEGNGAKSQRNYSTLKNAAQNLALTKLHKGLLLSEGQMKNQNMQNSALAAIEEIVAETNRRISGLLAELE